MRTIIAPLASTIGGIAFQMSVGAGWFRNFEWGVPWVWALCAGLWSYWIVSHPWITTGRLKNFHTSVGRNIYVLRIALCVVVFFFTGFLIRVAVRPLRRPSLGDTTAKSVATSPQTSSNSAPQTEPTQKGGPKQRKKTNGTSTPDTTGNINIGHDNNGIANNGPNYGNQTVNHTPPSRVPRQEDQFRIFSTDLKGTRASVSVVAAGSSDDVQPLLDWLWKVFAEVKWERRTGDALVAGHGRPSEEGMKCYSRDWNSAGGQALKKAMMDVNLNCNYYDGFYTPFADMPEYSIRGDFVLVIGAQPR